MRLRFLVPSALLLAAAAGCDHVLQTEPVTSLPQSQMIVDAATARAALNGAYDALQDGSYYGLDMLMLGDLAADNTVWTGTYQFLKDISNGTVQADNPEITDTWSALYRQIDRDNVILSRVPQVPGIPDSTRNDITGQAYFLRALGYHNLVKYWGAVPMPLVPAKTAADAQKYARVPVDQVYAQIIADLDKAQQLIGNASNTRYATPAAARALRARVLLYRAGLPGNASSAADYQGALDAANAVLAGRDTLTTPYSDLFSASGTNTWEDVFRVSFTSTESNSLGNYYLTSGRAEVGPSPSIVAAYPSGDLRKAASVRSSTSSNHPLDGVKFSARPGTEHVHVIRLAELVLIKAEVLARQNLLAGAVAEYDKVRVRAGLPAHVLGVDVTTQADVLAAIDNERRLELAFEGDRFPDLARTGRVAAVKPLNTRGSVLFPIPLREISSTNPPLAQNPGY